jgi:hypothetical protein
VKIGCCRRHSGSLGAVVKLAIAAFILLGFAALGLALASDLRGIAREHAQRSLASARPIGDVLGLRRTPENMQRSLAFVTAVQRAIGLVFALASLAVLIAVVATA